MKAGTPGWRRQAGTSRSNTITLGTDGTFGVITGATDSGENLTVRVRQGTQALAEDLEFLITEYKQPDPVDQRQ